MALGRTCVTLVLLLVVTTSKAMPRKDGLCVLPYVLRGVTPTDYQEDETGENICSTPKYRLFGDLCVRLHLFGSYSKLVEMDFTTATKYCEIQNASLATMIDLSNPNVMKAAEEFIKEEGAIRELLMADHDSCVFLNPDAPWGLQFTACPCNEKRNKMIFCKLPCGHAHEATGHNDTH
ncbi:PREDICTED: uncharacterized protein LOC109475662 [Branchiostoma belcheri]|uniref:Uncharacterized protein LOC109475662 n=1 Tax=Branchiostoma belcheri TaxID=7741 RepID=A0A6P4Z5T5_BRABE|nr:PREDICTED: uncharacterized protein LOC109475662 [Branchiostoma belcheri]